MENKKTAIVAAALATAFSVSAQPLEESTTFDNFYIGVNGGVSVNTKVEKWENNLCPNAGLRIGRYFTPVFGLAADGSAYFSNKPAPSTGTAVRPTNVSLLGTVNFSNWIGGYPGEPRVFEVVGLYGFGWAHVFGRSENIVYRSSNHDFLSSKAAVDFVFNLGSDRAWQFYIEPSITWDLNGDGYGGVKYDINLSAVQLNAGFAYKFGNSNGTHNFATANMRDQGEIDALNARINSLRGALSGKDAEIEALAMQVGELKEALDECGKKPREVKYIKPATATNLQPTVLFKVGSSVIEPAQYAPIELIANYMKNHPSAKVEIRGYASPEGSAEINQRLSENRAAAVKNALTGKYGISAGRLTTKGMGATDKLFEQVEFNRVATFNDSSKAE